MTSLSAPAHLLMLAPTKTLECDKRIIDTTNIFCEAGSCVTLVCSPQTAESQSLAAELLHENTAIDSVPENQFHEGYLFDLKLFLGRSVNTAWQRILGQWLQRYFQPSPYPGKIDRLCDTLAQKTFTYLYEKSIEASHSYWDLYFSLQLAPALYEKYRHVWRLDIYNYFYFIRALSVHRHQPIDMIYCNDLWALPVGCLLKELLAVPLIYDSHEIGTTVIEDPAVREIALQSEHWMYRLCDRFLTVNESCASYYYEKFPDIPKPAVITNGYRQVWHPTGNILPLKARLNLSSDAILSVYVGSLHSVVGLSQFILALPHTQQHICIAFLGGGGDIEALIALSKSLGLYGQRVFFPGRVHYREVPAAIYGADFGIIPNIQTIVNYGFNSSSKLYDYVQAGLPFISDWGPEIQKITDRFPVGQTVNFNQPPEAVAQLLDEFAGKVKSNHFRAEDIHAAKLGLLKAENALELMLPNAGSVL